MKNKGFSLVELIVVIAIMAILVGVAVPVYSSYIEKANAAKDEQLLGEINSAFAVVCAGNAIDINTVTDANIDVEDGAVMLSTMIVKVGSTEIAGFADAMVGILGNDLEFAVIEEIWYNTETHKFEENATLEVSYGGGVIILNAKDIAALKNSTFYNADGLGVNGLLNKVTSVTDFAADLLGGDSAFDDVLADDNFLKFIASTLGVEGVDNMTPEQLDDALTAKMDEIESIYGAGASDDVFVNGAVLYSAKNADAQKDTIMTILTSDDPKAIIVGTKNSGDVGGALSQASVAYGLYTAYAYGTEDQKLINSTSNPMNILNGLDDEDFQKYLRTEQAQKDLEGYMSAMNMINGGAGDEDAATELLVKGFGDSALADGLTDSIG